jgi:transcription antitermination factor NusG
MATTEPNWYALSVKSRHEFTVYGELINKGIESFLPSIMRVRQWKDRKKRVEFPLFPGYVFVSITPDPEAFLSVVKTRGTVRFISLEPGHPTPMDVEEINALKIVLAHGAELDVFPGLKQGDRVRVKSGIFQGAEGILEKKKDHHMLLISMELLGRSVGVKIAADEVEAA